MSRCKFCGGQIDWIWSQERGGYVKVDAEPVFVDLSGGEVTFITDEGGILRGRLAPATGDHTGQDVAFLPTIAVDIPTIPKTRPKNKRRRRDGVKKPRTEFGVECKIFMAETGMTVRELAQASGVKENTLVAAMVGKTPGHDLVPVVKGYMEKHRGGKEAAV